MTVPFSPRCRFAAGLILLLSLWCIGRPAASRASDFDDTAWNLAGTLSIRIVSSTSTVPMSGTLTLNADRTYVLDFAGLLVPDEQGVWYEDRGRLFLFTQNLQAEVLALQAALAIAFGEPVRLELTRATGKGSLDAKSGVLRVQWASQFTGTLVDGNLSGPVSRNLLLTGTPAPAP
jgi:hypothetical protein